jgi:hypothetical protein
LSQTHSSLTISIVRDVPLNARGFKTAFTPISFAYPISALGKQASDHKNKQGQQSRNPSGKNLAAWDTHS